MKYDVFPVYLRDCLYARGSGKAADFLPYVFLILLLLVPLYATAAIQDISSIKALTKTVQSEIQGDGVTILLNAAGIATAFFALITGRWTVLFFGAAYLVFVNVFFGFVNGVFSAGL